MFTRLRAVLGLALLISLLTLTVVLAKGGFDFITITGPDSKEAVQVTDTALTEDFFTFANFYEDRIQEPADPGEGYEILRYYREGIGARAFDRLHYYPESGYVFYDGLEGGWSEYDDQWYIANPDIKSVFEAVFPAPVAQAAPVEEQEAVAAVPQPETDNSMARSQPAATGIQSLPLILMILAGGLAALAVLATLALRRRKASTQ